jgi:hypothetical protein
MTCIDCHQEMSTADGCTLPRLTIGVELTAAARALFDIAAQVAAL